MALVVMDDDRRRRTYLCRRARRHRGKGKPPRRFGDRERQFRLLFMELDYALDAEPQRHRVKLE